MLSERALEYYKGGINCSQCILKACEDEYNFKISEDLYKACSGFYNGMGIGGCCGVLIACVMAIGILCDDVPYCRLEMVEKFNCKEGGMNCCKIKNNEGCESIIKNSCEVLADIIEKNSSKIKVNNY